jgi:hypothetical protein
VGRNIRSFQRVIKVKRSGCPRKITKRMMERLRLFVSCKPFNTGREIKQELVGFGDISLQIVFVLHSTTTPPRRRFSRALATPHPASGEYSVPTKAS